MASRGRANSRNKYRNLAATLALTIVMLVAFAFASFENFGGALAAKNVETWGALKNAVSAGETDIRITKDLVATEQITINKNVKISSSSDVTIYRHDGNTNFSVFKVEDGGNLELGEKVTMSGYVAKTIGDTGNYTEDSDFTVYWNVGYGDSGNYAVESTDASLSSNGTALARGTGLSCTIADNYIPEGYYFAGWRVKGFPGITGEQLLSNAEMKNKVKVPQTGGGVLRVKAKWKKKTVYTGSKDMRTHPVNGSAHNSHPYDLRYSPYGKDNLIRYDGLTLTLAQRNSQSNGFSAMYSPASGTTAGYFYLQSGSASGLNMYMGSDGEYHIRRFMIGENQNGSWSDYFDALASQWKYKDGYIVNALDESYCLVTDNGTVKLARTNQISGENITYANKWWNDGTPMNDGQVFLWTETEPSWMPSANVDITEIDKDYEYSTDKYLDQVEYVKANPLTDAQADNANQAHQEKFEGGKGFFVHVKEGGNLKISGANLVNFNTLTITEGNKQNIESKVPTDTAPVYVKGGENTNKTTGFEMTAGYIENNKVGYTAIEINSKDKTVQEIKKYLKDTPFTNTAGGVIFSGKNVNGTIKGGRIRKNKGDAGGIIVKDEATVTLGQNGTGNVGGAGGINKNVGFHHAGAALVQGGGTLFLRDGGEMFDNVTWSRGGAVWATEWGTNGYADADWSNWPQSYPTINNPQDRDSNGDGNFIMSGGDIHGNTAFIRAGAIEVESNGVELYGGKIYDNNCRSLGGAIYVEGDSSDYSYTLYVKEGYIGENVAVQRTNTTQKSVTNAGRNESTVNYVLDRYLNNGELQYCDTNGHGNGTNGTTYDRDFNGAMGNGGGIWLCPVGGTSVFADDKVVVDTNTATGTGNDFYLHRGNGAVMLQDINGDWYKEDGNGNKTNEAINKNGSVLKGPLPMGNYNSTVTTKENSLAGIQIYNNQSRDGGGIASNGTVMFGGPKNVYRYDARVELDKVWKTETGTKPVTFELYYKNGNNRADDPFRTIVLDGNEGVLNGDESQSGESTEDPAAGSNTPGVTNVGGQDIEGEWAPTTEGGQTVWHAGVLLPQYVEVNGQRKSLYRFKFTYQGTEYTLDPLNEDGDVLEKLYLAIQAQPDPGPGKQKELTLQVETFFDIVESETQYKVETSGLTATAVAKSEAVTIHNPATGQETSTFYVTFSTAKMQFTATNKDMPEEYPVSKTWLKADGNTIEVTEGTDAQSSAKAYYSWPASGVDSLTFKLKKGNDVVSTYKLTKKQIEALLAKDANVDGLIESGSGAESVSLVNNGGLKDRVLEYRDADEQLLYKVGFERRDYAMCIIDGEVIYSEPFDNAKAERNINNYKNEIVQAANEVLASRGLPQTATANNVDLSETGKRVMIPRLIFLANKYDDDGQEIAYTIQEAAINGTDKDYYTQVEAPTQNSGGAWEAYNKFNRVEIPATKVWRDQYGDIIKTKSYTKSNGSRIEFKKNGADVYVNWPSSGADSININVKDTTGNPAGSVFNKTVLISADDIKTLLDGDTPQKNNGRLELRSKIVDGDTVYYPVVIFTAPYGEEFEVKEQNVSSNYKVTYENTGSALTPNFTVTNKYESLTNVEATKKWDSLNSTTWVSGKTLNFYLKRWYKYDSFHNEMWQRKMSESLYIVKGSSRLSVTKSLSDGKYYVIDGSQSYPVQHNAYVAIDGMMYALQGDAGTIDKDHNNENKKVLVNPLDKDGEEILDAKHPTQSQRTVIWTDLPEYDAETPASSTLTTTQQREIKKIRYWVEEEWVPGYVNHVSYAENSDNKFNVLNKQDTHIAVSAEKKWNDGNPAERPTIKFELWRATYNKSGGDWIRNSHGGIAFKMDGAEYEYTITPQMSGSEMKKTWTGLPAFDSTGNHMYSYAPREALLIGQDVLGNDVYIYVNDVENGIGENENQYPSRGEIEIVYNETADNYKVTVWQIRPNGTRTGVKIDEKIVKTLDQNAKGYQSIVDYDEALNPNTGQADCKYYDIVAYNIKPAIEKYVNQDVHEDLETKDEVFTYDIMAYVPKDSKEIKIYDPLVKALEFVDKDGKKQSQTGLFDKNNLVTVAYMDTNNHKAVSKDANGSVTNTGTILGTDKYSVDISRKPQNGYSLGSTTDTEYWSKLQNYIGLSDEQYENKLTVTIPESTLSGNTGENGKWVKVTFNAKIRDDIDFAGMKPEQRTALGFGAISENDPVDTAISSHTGFKNKASYDVSLTNGYTFENIPSNTVTVTPPTSLIIEKKVTGTLGDLNKEFVFHVKLTGLKNNGGTGGQSDTSKRDYYYGALVNGSDEETDKVKVYMHSDLNDATHRTYTNGFNVAQGDNVSKELWVKLRAGQSLEIKDLPIGATYTVTEWASDHEPSYNLTEVNTVVKETTRQVTQDDVTQGRLVKDGDKWIKATAGMVGQIKTLALNVKTKDNSGAGNELATTTETVDAGEIVIITYTNHRDIMTQTGIIKDTWPWNIILLVVLIVLGYDDRMRKIKNRLRMGRATAL